jgi:hypothetical protein
LIDRRAVQRALSPVLGLGCHWSTVKKFSQSQAARGLNFFFDDSGIEEDFVGAVAEVGQWFFYGAATGGGEEAGVFAGDGVHGTTGLAGDVFPLDGGAKVQFF